MKLLTRSPISGQKQEKRGLDNEIVYDAQQRLEVDDKPTVPENVKNVNLVVATK